MKKIIALLLSILMVVSMTAFAEEETSPALVIRLGNIVIESTAGGATNTTSLDGFDAYLSIDTTDGLSLIAQAFNGDESLLLAVMKFVDSQLHLAIDGMDKTFTQDVPQLAGQDTAALGEMMRPMLPELMNINLPMIQVASLPKIDLTGLVSMLGAQTEGVTTTFNVPAELIDMLLDQIIETGKTAAESVPGADQIFGMLEQLRASGFSFSLSGQIVDSPDQQTTAVNLYTVTEGQVAEAPVVTLNLVSVQDSMNLKVDVPNGEETMTIAELQLSTENDAFLGTLDLAGMMQFSLTAYQEDGMQKAALNIESMMSDTIAVTLSYGNDGASNLFELNFAVGETAGLNLLSASVPGDDGVSGNIDITYVNADNSVHITTDYEEFLGAVDLGDFTMPAETAPMDAAQDAENAEALQTALMPLLQYIAQFLPANTAA